MNRIKRLSFVRAALSFVLLGLPNLAAAQSYWYLGGGVGHAGVNEGIFDDNDTAIKLFGGWAFNQYFAIEGLYADFGEQTSRFISPGIRSDLEGSSFGLGVRGEIPLGQRWGIYGRLGASFWDGEVTTHDGNTPISVLSGDGTDVYFGVGGRFKWTESFSIFLDFDRFKLDPSAPGTSGSDFDMNVWTLGVEFDFGRG